MADFWHFFLKGANLTPNNNRWFFPENSFLLLVRVKSTCASFKTLQKSLNNGLYVRLWTSYSSIRGSLLLLSNVSLETALALRIFPLPVSFYSFYQIAIFLTSYNGCQKKRYCLSIFGWVIRLDCKNLLLRNNMVKWRRIKVLITSHFFTCKSVDISLFCKMTCSSEKWILSWNNHNLALWHNEICQVYQKIVQVHFLNDVKSWKYHLCTTTKV